MYTPYKRRKFRHKFQGLKHESGVEPTKLEYSKVTKVQVCSFGNAGLLIGPF